MSASSQTILPNTTQRTGIWMFTRRALLRALPGQVRKHLVRFVADKSHNHAVQVEEEHDQVESQLDEGFLAKLAAGHAFAIWYVRACGAGLQPCPTRGLDCTTDLLVHVKLPKDLGRVQEMLVFKDPVLVSMLLHAAGCPTYFFPFQANKGRFKIRATQYPLIRKRKVRKAWTAASGTM